ncbi:MarR family winged helix-turn-helix transcriptional regulator [Paenibacillus mesotrionivorans]|uniref:MarR family winged helix-turn-helix transcriptional regulator n=1 Tax=Paenibacillus mesotrionivorans TaxID=3160968 RepID=A0ACC7P195_9BACL
MARSGIVCTKVKKLSSTKNKHFAAVVIRVNNIELIWNAVRAINRNIGALEKSEILCCGVTIGQCHAVLEIGLAGEISLNELARLLNLDKSTMSRTVNNLVTDEWVERATDSENRRYVKLKLSKNGQALYEKINDVLNSYFEKVMYDIPENKREQVAESLTLLIQSLNKNSCC